MTELYVKEQGAKVHRRGDRVVVSKQGQVLDEVPLSQVEQLVMVGNVQVTKQAINAIRANGGEIVSLSRGGKYEWRIVGPESGHARLRGEQLRLATDPAFSLQMAKGFVEGKINNQRVLLARQRQRLATTQREPEIAGNLSQFEQALAGMQQMRLAAQGAGSIDSLRGYEGKAAAYYFQALGAMLAADWQFAGRNYYPPRDPFNALLSFCYSLVLKDVLAVVYQTGFDPYVGFFHAVDYGRPSLALDLMEEWRPLVGDALALELVNRGALHPGDFQWTGNSQRPVELGDAGTAQVMEGYSRRMQIRVYHPDAGPGGETQLKYVMLLQARRLARVLTGKEAAYEPFKNK